MAALKRRACRRMCRSEAVLCCGAFTNPLLSRSSGLGPPMPHAVSRRTVLLGRVSEATRARLARMPAMKVACEPGDAMTSAGSDSERDRLEAGSVYILPPIWYDELGGWYLKIGGGANDFIAAPADALAGEIAAWRGAAGHPEQERFLRAMARKVLPGIKVEAWLTKNCISTSDGDAPLSRELRTHGRVMVVANAQGKGVMASHAIGDEVARLVTAVVHSRL